MKKVLDIYLDEDERLVLMTEEGEQYRIDWEDFIDPRWTQITKDNIHYHRGLEPIKICHVNPNCPGADLCEPHGERGPVRRKAVRKG